MSPSDQDRLVEVMARGNNSTAALLGILPDNERRGLTDVAARSRAYRWAKKLAPRVAARRAELAVGRTGGDDGSRLLDLAELTAMAGDATRALEAAIAVGEAIGAPPVTMQGLRRSVALHVSRVAALPEVPLPATVAEGDVVLNLARFSRRCGCEATP